MYYQPTVIYSEPNVDRTNSVIRYIGNRVMNSNNNFVVAITGMTGCQPKGSRVLMADGSWKNIEDIKVNDIIISPQEDGTNKFCSIKNLTSFYSQNTFNVTQLNRTHSNLYSCSDNHLIPVYHRANNRKTINGKRVHISSTIKFKEYKAIDLFNMSSKPRSHNHIAFSSFPIKQYLNKSNCEIEPYTLGVFLGDGMFRSIRQYEENKRYDEIKRKDKQRLLSKNYRMISITSNDPQILEEVSKYYSIINVHLKQGTTAKNYAFSVKGELSRVLSKYGLEGKNSGTKFIPKEAMTSDLEYRKKLLAGLIDTDGYYQSRGYGFTLKSKQLIEDIRDLVYSLGGRVYQIRKVTKGIKSTGFKGEYYRLSFFLGDLKLPLLVKHKIKTVKSCYLSSNRMAIDLKESEPQMVYGFELDSSSGWYITDNWMVTHNSGKSWAAISIAEMYAKMFNINFDPNIHIISSLKELLMLIVDKEKLKNIVAGSVIVFDEPQVESNARTWQSDVNQAFSQLISTFRNQRIVLIFATPFLEMIDKQSRILFHGEFECIGYDKDTKITKLKPRFLEFVKKIQDFYRKRLIIKYKVPDKEVFVKKKLNFWHVPMARKELIDTYEDKKKAFTDHLNKKLLNNLELAEKQAEGRNKSDELFKVRELFDEWGEDYVKILEALPHLSPFTVEKYIQFIKKSRKHGKLPS